ncbi:carotenoid oxygenase [Cokeromyces recurvatus]|uniref:carotenoid oxygenase n=1 Tax=Cokeromyces recurvatus TaxID=90255 RepID=UPI00221F1C8D|nr:carotenoid oxygenase [Cokeromyces recurvatus]KAI7898324.1 carotenoid oxygenase [Cokeromyces recurvatus]
MFLVITFVLLPGCLLFTLYYYYNKVYNHFFQVIKANYVPDSIEIQDPILLNIENGSIPTWLNGIMYRIGPGKFNIQQNDGSLFSIRHAFDGLPFMHRFEVCGRTQTLKYNSRLLAKSVETNISNKSYKGMLFFGHQPCLSFFQWLSHFCIRFYKLVFLSELNDGLPADGHMVGVTATPNLPLPSSVKGNNKNILVAKTDANLLQKIHAETLKPQHVFDYSAFDKHLNGQFSAAHHQTDHFTKETYNFTLAIIPYPRLIVFKISKDGEKTTILANITHRYDGSPICPSYIHSFWLTKEYIIIPESPMIIKNRGVDILMHGSFISGMKWDSNAPTYLHVIDRNSVDQNGLVASIPAPGFYTFHVGNGFESTCSNTGDKLLTLNCVSFSNGDILHQLHTFGVPHSKGPDQQQQQTYLNGFAYPPKYQTSFGDLMQYQLNLNQMALVSTKTLAENIEFPRFNQNFSMTAKHRYMYGCQLSRFTEKRDESICLIKIDLNDLSTTLYGDEQEGLTCSEPIFVSRPPNYSKTEEEEEDDGVLLTFVSDFKCCYFIVINAKDMKELARIKIGDFTAITFHGSFVDHEFKSVNIN